MSGTNCDIGSGHSTLYTYKICKLTTIQSQMKQHTGLKANKGKLLLMLTSYCVFVVSLLDEMLQACLKNLNWQLAVQIASVTILNL